MTPSDRMLGSILIIGSWLEREFTDRKACGSNPTSASRLPLSRLGQPGTIPALVLPSGSMAVRQLHLGDYCYISYRLSFVTGYHHNKCADVSRRIVQQRISRCIVRLNTLLIRLLKTFRHLTTGFVLPLLAHQ
ncbi:hypothetical protein CSKR_104985, partial [Clonorchis sinensis]